VARVDVVDITELANGPEWLRPRGSALEVDYRDIVLQLARKLGVAGRVVLSDNDDPVEVVNAIRSGGAADRLDVKVAQRGNLIYFYVHGPQPEVFIRQYELREPHAPS
jgi:acylphosphatase